MRAALFYSIGKPLEVKDVETPKVGAYEALIRIKACGICRTDLNIVDKGLLKPGKIPIILGHEASGVVVETGSGVKNINVGDRVIVHIYFSCGECYYCQHGLENLCVSPNAQRFGFTVDGGYAEYAKAPARNLIKLPNSVPYEAGILACAGSTAYRAVKNVGKVRLGETVMIMGAGGLGLCTLQFARLSGAKTIVVDVIEEKLKVAKELGADGVINPRKHNVLKEVLELTKGERVDIVFEFTGRKEAMEAALDSVKRRGRIVVVGYSEDSFNIHPIKLITDEIQMLGSRASTRRETLEALKLVECQKFKLEPLITHTFPLDKINYGFELVREGIPIRVVIKP